MTSATRSCPTSVLAIAAPLVSAPAAVAARYRPARVRALFDALAATYHWAEWASGGLLAYWRRCLVRALRFPTGPVSVVDLMAGGADLWPALHRRLGPRLHVTAVDFSAPMLARAAVPAAHPQRTLLVADALATPLPTGSAAIVTCAFGLKTLAPGHYPALAAEAARLLRPGGQFALLELVLPTRPWPRRALLAYLRLLPAVLKHLHPAAATHAALPRYARRGPSLPALLEALQQAGFRKVSWRRAWPGCALVVTAEK